MRCRPAWQSAMGALADRAGAYQVRCDNVNYTLAIANLMTSVPSPTIGTIRDLTDEVVIRTMNALRAKLGANELAALERLVAAGTFLDSKTILAAIADAQDRAAT